jgi:hypothetical protein
MPAHTLSDARSTLTKVHVYLWDSNTIFQKEIFQELADKFVEST